MAKKSKSVESQLDLFDNQREAPPAPARPVVDVNIPLAEVAVDGPVRGTFTYRLNDDAPPLAEGARVLVPFGGRTLSGFYVGPRTVKELAAEGVEIARIKPIIQVLDESAEPLLTPKLLSLARWMSRHYAAPLGSTMAAMLPAGVKKGAEGARVRLVTTDKSAEELLDHAQNLLEKKPKQAALLHALSTMQVPGRKEAISAAMLLAEAEAPDSALKAIAKAGLVSIHEERGPDEGAAHQHTESSERELVLNAEQQAALTKIETALANKQYAGFLLQGVTGSGKTEVYLRALKTALAQGRQGIVLVPEIALTPQTAQRFEQRLGRERVAVLHSHVTEGDRADAWRAIRAGKIDVVVGARSALFAPLPRLGVVIIDEEHEGAFKQESTPRYHARDVGMELARLTDAVLVLGSATPSFEALHAARTEKLTSLMLTQRVAGRPMPPVEIVDMTRENREVERYSYLSRRLLDALATAISRREQTILFMNRRGFATVITCLRCGHTEKCAQCDITLTSHRANGDVLTCHYCNFTKPMPDLCSGCGGPGIKHWGMGTERVEAEVRKVFPTARVARMDSDTMTRRTAYLEALGNFRAGNTDILVGTQMIAKGLDFPNVTLVGVVLADTALHMPDFRSRERTFQLLAQVAGRAGRGDKGGRVIIQTHLPADPAIRAAAQHDFDAFSLQELQERRAFSYPPFTRLARILFRGKDQKVTQTAALSIAQILAAELKRLNASCQILGPAEPPIARIEGFFRQHILLKAASSELLSELLNGPAAVALTRLKGAEASVDVDPLAML